MTPSFEYLSGRCQRRERCCANRPHQSAIARAFSRCSENVAGFDSVPFPLAHCVVSADTLLRFASYSCPMYRGLVTHLAAGLPLRQLALRGSGTMLRTRMDCRWSPGPRRPRTIVSAPRACGAGATHASKPPGSQVDSVRVGHVHVGPGKFMKVFAGTARV
jgi:hypothetical protein